MKNFPLAKRFTAVALALFCLLPQVPQVQAAGKEYLVYFGTYTGAKSRGIYVSRLNAATGRLTPPELAAEVKSPSFLAVHPNNRFIYSVNEIGDFQGRRSGGASAFSIDRSTGRLTLLNQQSSKGDGPCHIVTDKRGRHVLLANYGGGSTTVLPVRRDGSLGEASAFVQHQGSSVNKQRQEAPHAHCVTLDPANRFAFVADLGLDQVLSFHYNPAKGTLAANDPSGAQVQPGAGPRHFAFDPKGRFGYVINEIDCTISAFSYNARHGTLNGIQTVSTLPAGESVQPGYSTAEIEVHPSGKFVYGSNRGHNTIAVFAIEPKAGTLALVQHASTLGKIPRSFGIDPTGRWFLAANQDTHNVFVFAIDPQTGQLSPTGQSVDVGAPVCVKFVPAR